MVLSGMILKSELIVASDDVDAFIKLDTQRVHEFYDASSQEDEFSPLCAISRDFTNIIKIPLTCPFLVSSAQTPHSLRATHEFSEDLVSPSFLLTSKETLLKNKKSNIAATKMMQLIFIEHDQDNDTTTNSQQGSQCTDKSITMTKDCIANKGTRRINMRLFCDAGDYEN